MLDLGWPGVSLLVWGSGILSLLLVLLIVIGIVGASAYLFGKSSRRS